MTHSIIRVASWIAVPSNNRDGIHHVLHHGTHHDHETLVHHGRDHERFHVPGHGHGHRLLE
jgi:hypothetical protein